MANTFLQFMLREVDSVSGHHIKWSFRRKIRDYVVGLIPEPVRKIVGLILIIFGVVVMFGTWTSGIFTGGQYEVLFIIGFIVSVASIYWGIALLRHKG